MMRSLLFKSLLLTCYAVFCSCTLLSSTGYIAASSPVRNFLVSTGLGESLHQSSQRMYRVSGFLQAADPGTSIRKAKMKGHQIVETDSSAFNRRSGPSLATQKLVETDSGALNRRSGPAVATQEIVGSYSGALDRRSGLAVATQELVGTDFGGFNGKIRPAVATQEVVGTDSGGFNGKIRPAVATQEVVETDSDARNRRSGLSVATQANSTGSANDRKYSEHLFGVLGQMDKKSCVYRLLCEIGADPSAFGLIGYKIKHYVKSVPPVTWNSATFSYKEAYKAGLAGGKSVCKEHFLSCNYNLNSMMSRLSLFFHPFFRK